MCFGYGGDPHLHVLVPEVQRFPPLTVTPARKAQPETGGQMLLTVSCVVSYRSSLSLPVGQVMD